MAVDTREKRASGVSVAGPWLVQLPLADGTVGTPDRPQVLWTYSGITIDAPNVSLDGDQATQLGTTGTPQVYFPDDVAVTPTAQLNICTYKTLICDRAVTLSTAIDNTQNSFSTTIEATYTHKTLICTRAITISTEIDDTAITIDTEIGCT